MVRPPARRVGAEGVDARFVGLAVDVDGDGGGGHVGDAGPAVVDFVCEEAGLLRRRQNRLDRLLGDLGGLQVGQRRAADRSWWSDR